MTGGLTAFRIDGDALLMYRALIDGFLVSEVTPSSQALAVATGMDEDRVSEVLRGLADTDWLGQDDAGNVVALYPFSPVATGITVTLDGVTRHAMCALDALGVAPMLDRSVKIASTCMDCGAPVDLLVTPSRLEQWSPPELVITARCGSGAAHATRCHAMRFACSEEHARRWMHHNRATGDLVLEVESAFQTAQQRFATCYREGRCERPLHVGAL